MFLKYVWSSYNHTHTILKISLDRRKYLFNNTAYYYYHMSKYIQCQQMISLLNRSGYTNKQGIYDAIISIGIHNKINYTFSSKV